MRGSAPATVFEFAVAGRFPVELADVALPGNSAVEWTLESRDGADANWRHRAGPWVAFRLGTDASHSPPRQLDGITRDRQWRLRAIHFGTNNLDNPVLTKVKNTLIRDGIIGAVVALAIGIGLGFLVARRRRTAVPA